VVSNDQINFRQGKLISADKISLFPRSSGAPVIIFTGSRLF